MFAASSQIKGVTSFTCQLLAPDPLHCNRCVVSRVASVCGDLDQTLTRSCGSGKVRGRTRRRRQRTPWVPPRRASRFIRCVVIVLDAIFAEIVVVAIVVARVVAVVGFAIIAALVVVVVVVVVVLLLLFLLLRATASGYDRPSSNSLLHMTAGRPLVLNHTLARAGHRSAQRLFREHLTEM